MLVGLKNLMPVGSLFKEDKYQHIGVTALGITSINRVYTSKLEKSDL